MAKINTNLGVSVSLQNAPTPQPVMSTGQQQIVGKDKFEALADTLATINPTIKKLADQKLKERNEASFEEGKAKINGMTLDEAREAHKNGFPDVFNGWARYGAHKQYAINSTDNFIQDFKNQYWSRRNETGYNWQEHYNELSQQYLADKQGDEFFASAYNEGTSELRRWLNVKEFEKQEEDLQYKVIGNTSLSIQGLPTKVEEQLEIAFYDANPPMTLGKNYQERKAKFFQENMSKTFKDMFYKLKENRNPAMSLADFDDVLINEAELHAKLDGRFSNEYIELLTSNRPDGTPAIINNPKYQKRVSALVDDLRDAVTLGVNTQSWFMGNVGSMSKTDRTKLASDIFDKEYRIKKSQGLSNSQAFQATTMTLMSGLKRNEPVKQIADLLEKPLTREYTEDNKLALEIYSMLDKNGITGIYFKENDKNKYKFFVANLRKEAGEDPRDIILSMGTMDTTTKEINDLTSADKQKIQSFSANMANPRNQELAYMTAKYFKNIAGGTDTDYIKQAEKFLDQYYTDVNGRYVSNYKMAQFGVKPEQYDSFKSIAIEMLKEKLNTEKNIIEETDITGFFFDETNLDFPETNEPNVDRGIDLDKYELIVNTEDDVLYFKEDDGSPLEIPATVEYKDGQTVWLQVPIKLVKERFDTSEAERQAKQAIEDEKRLKEKDALNRKRKQFNQQTKDMVP
jgi:hypothetical protein